MKNNRKRKFVDPTLQGAILLRLVLHWALFVVTAGAFLVFVEMVTSPPGNAGKSLVSRHGPTLLALIVLAPIFLRDLCNLTNRFAGPMVRLKQAMRDLAEGREVAPLCFREDDFWKDLAYDFNRVVERAQSAKIPVEDKIPVEEKVPVEDKVSQRLAARGARLTQTAARGNRHGAAAVEFAVVAPLFFLLLAGIMEFGQAFQIEHLLSNACRRGARAAVVAGATSSGVQQVVKSHCVKTLRVAGSDVTVQIAVNGNVGVDVSQADEGAEISVTVSIPFNKAGIGFYALMFSHSTMKATCVLEHE